MFVKWLCKPIYVIILWLSGPYKALELVKLITGAICEQFMCIYSETDFPMYNWIYSQLSKLDKLSVREY